MMGGTRIVNTGLRRAAIAVAALSLLTGACGSSSDSKSAKDQPAPAASPAASAQSTAAASATATARSRSFTDDAGKTLTIATPPKRVVALSPSAVEFLYAVGAPPVARPSSATYPEAAKSLPAIGSSYQPNFEQIAAQTPDLILADAQIQTPQTQAELAKLGAPVFSLRVQTVADVIKGLRTIGNITAKYDEGEKAAKELETKLQGVQSKLPAEPERPKVFIMVGTPDAFFAAKPDSFAGDVVQRLGAKNLVTEGPDTVQFPGFTTYSLERLVALDPDEILVITVGGPNTPPTSKQLAGNPAWSGLRAVKAGRVHELPSDTLVQGAGPRVSGVIDMLAPVLYPGRF